MMDPYDVVVFGQADTTVDVTGQNSWGTWWDTISEDLQGFARVAVNAWAATSLSDTFGTTDPVTGQPYVQGQRAPASNSGGILMLLAVGVGIYLLAKS